MKTKGTAALNTSFGNKEGSDNDTSALLSHRENDTTVCDKISNASKNKNLPNFENSMASLKYRDRKLGNDTKKRNLLKYIPILITTHSN